MLCELDGGKRMGTINVDSIGNKFEKSATVQCAGNFARQPRLDLQFRSPALCTDQFAILGLRFNVITFPPYSVPTLNII